jgi:hypothetical protein
MSDVIRRAIIEIETRQKRSRLEAPGADATTGFKAQTEAAGKAEQATDRASEATKRHAEVVRSSAYTMVRDFREAGEGAFRMARGLTLLAASGSEDMKRLVHAVALAQGAFDVFAGGFKTVRSLTALLGGPLALAITAVTATVGAGVVVWQRWKNAAEQAAKEIAERLSAVNKEIEKTHQRNESRADRRIAAAITDDTRLKLLREEVAKAREEGRQAAASAKATFPIDIPAREIIASDFRIAEQKLQREAELLGRINEIERQRDQANQQALNEVLRAGSNFFGFKTPFQLPDTSVDFQRAEKDLDRGIQAILRMAETFGDRAEEIERGTRQLQNSK